MSGSAPLVVVGPGRLGSSVAAALEGRDGPVVLVGRRPDLPADLLVCPGLTLLFTVSDDALEGAVRSWSERFELLEPTPGRVALHSSGVDGPEVLDPLRARGFSVGCWHPLVAIPSPDPESLHGVTCGVRGEREAVERARELCESVGAAALRLHDVEAVRYHAAAVFASNCLVACLAVAVDELWAATEGEARLEHILPLARAALSGAAEHGLADGLTGPVCRGDAGTVRRHLTALDSERAALYRGLARELLALVEADLPEAERAALEAALRDGASGGEEAG